MKHKSHCSKTFVTDEEGAFRTDLGLAHGSPVCYGVKIASEKQSFLRRQTRMQPSILTFKI